MLDYCVPPSGWLFSRPSPTLLGLGVAAWATTSEFAHDAHHGILPFPSSCLPRIKFPFPSPPPPRVPVTFRGHVIWFPLGAGSRVGESAKSSISLFPEARIPS